MHPRHGKYKRHFPVIGHPKAHRVNVLMLVVVVALFVYRDLYAFDSLSLYFNIQQLRRFYRPCSNELENIEMSACRWLAEKTPETGVFL